MTKSRGFVYTMACMLAGACGSSMSGDEATGSRKEAASDASLRAGGSISGGAFGPSTGGAVALDAKMPAPPEIEEVLNFLSPQAGGRYVYVANPTRDSVAIIDSLTLAITEVTPGDAPTYLATVAGKDVAIVVNVGSNTLSILRDTRVVRSALPIVKSANVIAMAPDGVHAVVWFDPSRATAKAITGGLQDVTLVNLTPNAEAAYTLTVGFQPSGVVFSDDGTAAFVITGDGISKLVFANIRGDAIAPLVRIGGMAIATSDTSDGGTAENHRGDAQSSTDGALADAGSGGAGNGDGGIPDAITDALPTASDGSTLPPANVSTTFAGEPMDVSVTRNGRYAIARREGSQEVILVDLESKVVKSRRLSSAITDLDLWNSGTSGGESAFAFAVLRSEGLVVRMPIPEGFTEGAPLTSWKFPQENIGSVSVGKSGKYALLYTTAASVPRVLVLPLGPSATEPQAVSLHKSVRAVAIAPDEKTALVLHTKVPGSAADKGLTLEEQLNRSYGYSVVHLENGFAKLQLTAAMPEPFVITPDSTHAFVLLRDDALGLRLAERISLESFRVKDFPMGSPPSSVGTLSSDSKKVFVSQVHSEGRISFIDWQSDEVETVTGFALNGRIRQ